MDIDKRSGTALFADIADEHFGLLTQPFNRGRGGLAERN